LSLCGFGIWVKCPRTSCVLEFLLGHGLPLRGVVHLLDPQPGLQLGLGARHLEAVLLAGGLELRQAHGLPLILRHRGLVRRNLRLFLVYPEGAPAGQAVGAAEEEGLDLRAGGRVEVLGVREVLGGPVLEGLQAGLAVHLSLLLNLGQVLVLVHADAVPLHVREQLAEGPHVRLVVVQHGLALLQAFFPLHLAQQLGEAVVDQPGALGIKSRVLDPVLTEEGVHLQRAHVRHLLHFRGLAALQLPRHAEQLLHALLDALRVEGLGQRLQAVARAPGHGLVPGGIPQPRHVHGVPREPPGVNPHVIEHMSVKSIVMPNLLAALVLEPWLEHIQ